MYAQAVRVTCAALTRGRRRGTVCLDVLTGREAGSKTLPAVGRDSTDSRPLVLRPMQRMWFYRTDFPAILLGVR